MNDPTDTEGQRLIEEQIRLKNIIMARNYAIEHMPEAYIPVNMLYISIKINGVLTQAFIDTGAQLSILSDSEALRCGLLDVMDKAYNVTVHGVAGKMECIGKIHACVVQIGDNCYHCNFEVLSGQATPVLIGLDFLRRHLCVIDLKNDCLRFYFLLHVLNPLLIAFCKYISFFSFGDSSKTKFLSDAEINISHHHHQ
ncbi:unnamed protein product [Dracunculus medinensis]|uniref:Asp_protease domain-containing protein n=1 Tax=Dracunculus medinensis TaxID=318479 RepID=A0A0N4UIP0_DRAME|nr:unnamed protein product [Dracunculus medinensis]